MKLQEIAHSRAGDKGNIVNISLIAFREDDYAALERQITVERVSKLFAPIITRPVERYCVPALGALNFVLHRPASESVTRSLALDPHGKTLSFALLNMEIDLE
ncbi:MAG: hypothetical protein ABSF53_05940 [Terracidiphilus sp.]|jgi:hypothetical protein